MTPRPVPLAPETLRPRCDPSAFRFETTAEVEPLASPLGQARALEALAFGTGIRREGFHLFVMGSTEAGRRALVEDVLRRRAAAEPASRDLCYVRDFDDPRRPRAALLPAGRGRAWQRDVDELLDDLRAAILKGNGPWPHQYCPSRFCPKVQRPLVQKPRVKHRPKLRP